MSEAYRAANRVTCTEKKDENERSLVGPNDLDEELTTEVSNSETVETRCGVGPFRPSILQKCNNPQVLCCCLCVYTLIHGK